MRIKLFLLSILCNSFIWGQGISQSEARAIGIDFLSQKKENTGHTTRGYNVEDQYKLTYTAEKDGKICFYIFNCSSGGYFIVSADEKSKVPVLGYSLDGCLEYDKLGPSAKVWIDGYKDMVSIPSCQSKDSTVKCIKKLTKSVAPLLGNISWGQGYPYNLECPEIEGIKCVTGCEATAMAQIMYYHQWPSKGNGKISYVTDYHVIESDLSDSEYKWEDMLPTYYGNESEKSKEAVSKLMRDCGYALRMNYDLSGSEAVTGQGAQWIRNFDYDKSIRVLPRSLVDDDEWNRLLHEELDNGRPIVFEGCNDAGVGHAFVCDGYDDDNYYHFNFGWDGIGNGYFTTEEGFHIDQDIICGIDKNHGGSHILDFLSASNFIYDESEKRFNSFLLGRASISDVAEGCSHKWSVDAIMGVGVENLQTGDIRYFESGPDYPLWNSSSIRNFVFNCEIKDLDDGYYKVWPVGRNANRDDEWTRCKFRKDCAQQYVSLNVKDGKMSFINDILNDVSSGIVYVNGLFYRLDDSELTATVTSRNDMPGLYHDEINIPKEIVYNDKTYIVNEIDNETFLGCEHISLTIPSTIKRIGKSAFRGVYLLNEFAFPEDSELEFIDDYAFDCLHGWEELRLPQKVKEIGEFAFRSIDGLKLISIPSSVTTIGGGAFMWSKNVKDVYVYWEEPLDIDERVFYDTDLTRINLHVPVGTMEKYQKVYPWSEFKIIEDYDFIEETIVEDGIHYTLHSPDMTAMVVKIEDSCPSEIVFPENVVYNGQSYLLTSIEDWVGHRDNVYLKSVHIPMGVESLGEYSFREQVDMEKVTFAENSNLKSIGSCCFEYCSNLQSVIFPKTLEYISVFAFSDCSSLQLIDLPASLKEIDQSAFENCTSLKDVTVHWIKPLKIHRAAFENDDFVNMVLHVPHGTKSKYEEIVPWSLFGQIIEDVDPTFEIPVESIILSESDWTGKENDILRLKATVLPENASCRSVTWSSSNETVAYVDEMGTVYILNEGSCVITATADDGSGVYAKCNITSSGSGVKTLFNDQAQFELYNLNGILIKQNCNYEYLNQLNPGLYIIREGSNIKKIIIL